MRILRHRRRLLLPANLPNIIKQTFQQFCVRCAPGDLIGQTFELRQQNRRLERRDSEVCSYTVMFVKAPPRDAAAVRDRVRAFREFRIGAYQHAAFPAGKHFSVLEAKGPGNPKGSGASPVPFRAVRVRCILQKSQAVLTADFAQFPNFA